MRAAERAFITALVWLAASPVQAAAPETMQFQIPAGRLADALIALGEQARITIAVDPALARRHARALRGAMPVRAALERLLAGSGYRFVFAAPGVVRIVPDLRPPSAPPGARRAAPPPPRRAAAPRVEVPAAEIVVTASKQAIPLAEFSGTAHVVTIPSDQAARLGGRGSAALVERLPMLAATNLGPSRNKLFIRGIADSSFNGPSQSVAGQYLGDVRLTFNAPDPDLRLYDVARIELLEGPQGTLYGSGSLGGILRIVPNPPDLGKASGLVAAGLAATNHGGPGGDVSAMVNVPLAPGRLGLRAVGYSVVDGGYIDDVRRGLNDVNRTTITGGRATLLLDTGAGWQFELGALAQFVAGRDGQYTERGLPPLTRRSAIAQPFDNDYLLGHFTVRRNWGALSLVSTSEWVDHSIVSEFDASGFPGTTGPIAFREQSSISMIANETRLGRAGAGGTGWVAGWSLVHDADRTERSLGPPGAVMPRSGVRNAVDEAALFGQYALKLLPRITLTLGGRVTYSATSGKPLFTSQPDEPVRHDFRVSPTFALGWRPAPKWLVYARYGDGFRAGGLALGPSRAAARRFQSDELASSEVGIRFGGSQDNFSFDAAASHAVWTNLQADLIDGRGLPFTANIGTGRIEGLETSLSWRPARWLRLDAAAFLDDSTLTEPSARLAHANLGTLPNIAEAGARAGAHIETRLSRGLALTLDGVIRYVGKSRLGIGSPLDVGQGDYVETAVGARLALRRFAVSIDVANAGDSRANSFAYGNPFAVGRRNQSTPLRPRTFRLGLESRF